MVDAQSLTLSIALSGFWFLVSASSPKNTSGDRNSLMDRVTSLSKVKIGKVCKDLTVSGQPPIRTSVYYFPKVLWLSIQYYLCPS